MKTSTILVLSIVVTIIVSVLCIWWTPSKEDFTDTNVSWNGTSIWRDNNIVSDISSLDTLPTNPQDYIMISIPETPYQESELVEIRNFISQGGYFILLDDYGYGNDILSYLEVSARFTNKTILDPLFCYMNPALPRITDFGAALSDSGIKSIVLNHASSLTGVNDTDVLAWSSLESFLDNNGNTQYDTDESKGPLPVAARFLYNKGTIVLFADPSIMINGMINLEDNLAIMQYLTQSPTGQLHPILFDLTHLEESTLDKSKAALYTIREFLAMPYALLGLVAIIFVLIYRYGFRKGELLG